MSSYSKFMVRMLPRRSCKAGDDSTLLKRLVANVAAMINCEYIREKGLRNLLTGDFSICQAVV